MFHLLSFPFFFFVSSSPFFSFFFNLLFQKELIGKKEDIGDPYFEGNWEQAYKDISSCVENLVRLVKTDDEIEI